MKLKRKEGGKKGEKKRRGNGQLVGENKITEMHKLENREKVVTKKNAQERRK